MQTSGGAGGPDGVATIASPALRARVRRLLLELGVVRGCKVLGVADRTSARLAAGFPVNPGSIALAERSLDAYDRDRAAGGANAGANESKKSSKTREVRGKSDAA